MSARKKPAKRSWKVWAVIDPQTGPITIYKLRGKLMQSIVPELYPKAHIGRATLTLDKLKRRKT